MWFEMLDDSWLPFSMRNAYIFGLFSFCHSSMGLFAFLGDNKEIANATSCAKIFQLKHNYSDFDSYFWSRRNITMISLKNIHKSYLLYAHFQQKWNRRKKWGKNWDRNQLTICKKMSFWRSNVHWNKSFVRLWLKK